MCRHVWLTTRYKVGQMFVATFVNMNGKITCARIKVNQTSVFPDVVGPALARISSRRFGIDEFGSGSHR